MENSFNRFFHKKQRGMQALEKRFEKLELLKKNVADNREQLSKLATLEMGKPINQTIAEVDKSIKHIDYYIQNTERFMHDEELQLKNGSSGLITHQPLGSVLVILPWNWPIWLVFKSALPPMILGNSILMKHAPSVPQTAQLIEEIFEKSGFGEGDFNNIFASNEQCEQIIADKRCAGVKFTGSTQGGRQVAGLIGKYMKKGTFELGGNDPFLVLKDAEIDKAVDCAYKSRMLANAQSCINAKRFFIQDEIFDEFTAKLISKIKTETLIGDPLDPKINLGPLALQKQVTLLKDQIKQAQIDGAQILHGDVDFKMSGELAEGNFVEPIVTQGIGFYSKSYDQEFFGPVFNLFRVIESKDILDYANKSDYGLAGTVWTKDIERAKDYAIRLRVGSVTINDMQVTYSELPSGGVKNSGYGRECYSDGLLEIANRKSIINRNW